MTESEAIEVLTDRHTSIGTTKCDDVAWRKLKPAIDIAVNALEEIQQYRAIGTVEECRKARERQIPKPPNIWGDGYDNEGNIIYDMYDCPNCCKSYEIDYHDYKYCPECGQAIDRSDLDNFV